MELSVCMERADEKILKLTIVLAGVILGGVLAYSLFQYPSIPFYWQLAITSFILLLPFSFFVQASLNMKALRDQMGTDMQNNLRRAFAMMETERKQKAMMELERMKEAPGEKDAGKIGFASAPNRTREATQSRGGKAIRS